MEVKVKERELGEALDWRAKLNTVPTYLGTSFTSFHSFPSASNYWQEAS